MVLGFLVLVGLGSILLGIDHRVPNMLELRIRGVLRLLVFPLSCFVVD
jgi:hypothetical protein